MTPTGMSPMENSIAGDVVRSCQLRVEDRHRVGASSSATAVDRGVVALSSGRADQAPERGEDRRRRPPTAASPSIGWRVRALAGSDGLERARAVFAARDSARWNWIPTAESVVFFNRRHQPVRVHREIGRLLVLAEGAADIDALMLEPEFADGPHRLLHIGRVLRPQIFSIACFLPCKAYCRVLSKEAVMCAGKTPVLAPPYEAPVCPGAFCCASVRACALLPAA